MKRFFIDAFPFLISAFFAGMAVGGAITSRAHGSPAICYPNRTCDANRRVVLLDGACLCAKSAEVK